MSEFNVLDYQPVIQEAIRGLRIKPCQKEDMEQECYLTLLRKQTEIKKARDSKKYVGTLCRNRIRDIQRQESQSQPNYVSEPGIRFESLSNPSTLHKALNVVSKIEDRATDEELQEAIESLPVEEKNVIKLIYIGGKTQAKTAEILKTSRWRVRQLKDSGVQKLKEFFDLGGQILRAAV